MEYEKMHDFSLFVEYETLTYNVFYMRHNFSHGHCGEMTEEQFKKLDEENMKKVLPSFNEITKRVGEENFKDWYRHQRKFWNSLDGNAYDAFCKAERARREAGEDGNSEALEEFLTERGYKTFVPSEKTLVEDRVKA